MGAVGGRQLGVVRAGGRVGGRAGAGDGVVGVGDVVGGVGEDRADAATAAVDVAGGAG